ncbi:MAG: radical SAM protein [Candidatus Latescibacteria bacterium]|jgi:radical SAM protein with 4Fe4S-binding SPASM domain|nr:radical SAM protein [Candidatus Latescibacterota bacterium]
MPKKLITHTQKHYGIREDAQEFPMMVVLSFVYVCNARCPNCPYNNSEIRATYKDAMIMSEAIFKRIADECGQYRSLLRISGGGEPMLHPKATELMRYAKEKGCRIGLITNGSRFHQENLNVLIEAGVDAIEFSVDAGNITEYDMVRPGLSWKILNRNVSMAIEIRDKLKAETRIIASIIDQKGIDVNLAETYWTKIVDKVQIRKYLTWGINANHSADETPYLPLEERIPCPWLFERLNIDSRGDVTLCGEDIAFNEKFANIMEYSIESIWRGKIFESFREMHLRRKGNEIPICLKCPDWRYRSWHYNYWKVLKDAEDNKR